MSGSVSFRKAQEVADRVQSLGLDVLKIGIFAVDHDGHIKLTITGLPEQWDAALARVVGIPQRDAPEAKQEAKQP